MTYEERRSIVSILGTILINVVFAAVMLPRLPETGAYSPEMFKFWGSYMLLLIPATVIGKIIIHIVFVIISTTTGGDYDDDLVDEREQLIKLKASQIAQVLFALGFMLAMVSLVIEQPPMIMFLIFLGAGILTDAVSNLAELYYYRRGI